jgi:hypothetical protein
MFKRFFIKLNPKEKASLYSYLDFLLACLSRLAELMALTLLTAGLAEGMASFVPVDLNPALIALLSLAPSCLVIMLVLALFSALRSDLRLSCGLDPRPSGVKIKAAFPGYVFSFLYLWLVSWAILLSMRQGHLFLWAGILAVSVWVFILLVYQAKKTAKKAYLRPIEPSELPAGLDGVLRNWKTKGQERGKLMIDFSQGKGLDPPSYLGTDIVIPQRALTDIPVEALKVGIVISMVSQMLNLKRNYLILRVAALTMAVPAAMFLLYSLGYAMGYPIWVRPGHIVLIWLGCWLSFHASCQVMNFVNRLLYHRLNLATAAIINQTQPIITNTEALALQNLVPWDGHWWDFFTSYYPSPKDQVKNLMTGISELKEEKGPPRPSIMSPPQEGLDQLKNVPLNGFAATMEKALTNSSAPADQPDGATANGNGKGNGQAHGDGGSDLLSKDDDKSGQDPH